MPSLGLGLGLHKQINLGINLGKMRTISNLPVGALVKDPTTKYYGKPIIWVIADKTIRLSADSVTLLSSIFSH